MESDSKVKKFARVKSDWVEDAVKLRGTALWTKWLATGLTAVSCVLYIFLYSLVSDYRMHVAEFVRDLPIFTRIVLNIYQPFLVVFIIVSLSLLVLLNLKIKKPWLRHKLLLGMIVFNCVFAAMLLLVSVVKVT